MKATVAHDDHEVSVFITKDTPIAATVGMLMDTFLSIVGRIPHRWKCDNKHGTYHLKFRVGADEKPRQVTKKVSVALKKLKVPSTIRY